MGNSFEEDPPDTRTEIRLGTVDRVIFEQIHQEQRSIAKSLASIRSTLDWLPFTLFFYLLLAFLFQTCITRGASVKFAPPPTEAVEKP